MKKFKIKKGDKVVVITGKCKGKSGEVMKVLTSDDKLLVSGINIVKKCVKSDSQNKGGFVEKESPIHISNVAMACGKHEYSKVGFRYNKDKEKERYLKKTGKVV